MLANYALQLARQVDPEPASRYSSRAFLSRSSPWILGRPQGTCAHHGPDLPTCGGGHGRDERPIRADRRLVRETQGPRCSTTLDVTESIVNAP